MHLACIIMALAIALPLSAQKPTTEPFTGLVSLKWKTFVGKTSYRTNILHYGSKILIGSNGHFYKDYAFDSDNGVCILSATDGKLLHRIGNENLGDMDVNGVAADGSKIYFGSDNDELSCYEISGEKVWTVPVSGDVEVEPLLLEVNNDGTKDVVFATESGEVAALNGINGAQLWSFKIKDFSGWKKTQNRFLFKVGDWFSNGLGFMCAPILVDIDKDGTNDVVAAARDGNLYALNGINGQLLWKAEHGGYMSQPPVLHMVNGEPRIYIIVEKREGNNWLQRLSCIDHNGKAIFQSMHFYPQYSFQTSIIGNELVVAGHDSLYAINIYTGAKRAGKFSAGPVRNYGNYITAKPLLLDLMGLGVPQLVLLGQQGNATMVSWQTMARLREYQLPAGTETSPLVTDVDCNGKLDILISAYDGYLYCFATRIPEKALQWAKR